MDRPAVSRQHHRERQQQPRAGLRSGKISIDAGNSQTYTSAGGNARLSWDLGDLTLHSITGYETVSHYFTRGDIDAGYGAVYAPLTDPASSRSPSRPPVASGITSRSRRKCARSRNTPAR